MAFENQAKLYCWQIARSTFHSVFVMPNGAIRIKIPPFDSALEIVLIMDVKCITNISMITKQQYSSDLWPLSLKAKRNCIVDKSLKIIKLIYSNYKKRQYVWSLITLVSLVFSFSAVYQWIRLTSLFTLIVFWAQKPQNIYFERFKAQFNPSVRTNWRLTVLKNLAYY
jgi:hypothetical protein